MRTEIITIDGIPITLTDFDVPMMHEDWHKAEALGLVFAWYCHIGPDYWDDCMTFCAPEHKEAVQGYLSRSY